MSALTRRSFVVGTGAVLAGLAMGGCSSSSSSSSSSSASKSTVRVAFWGQNMMYGMAPALREAFPEVDFQFIVAHNTTDYYKYLVEHDDLCDVLTVRKFSLLDAVDLKNELVDMRSTELASSYYQNYLQHYTFDDGTVNWLPAVAEVQSIIANKSLFERNNIDLPTDYPSFKSACEKFTELGIIPFANEWNADYGCLEVLEGINIEALQSKDGKAWRTSYESGKTAGLDSTVWPGAFERMETFLKDTGSLGSQYKDMTVFNSEAFNNIQGGMDKGLIAMVRNGGSDILGYNTRNTDEYVMLPYFGDTQEQNWVLTYPYYQAALNSRSNVDSSLLMKIYEFMAGQGGQDALGLGRNMMSYSKQVEVSLNDGMKTLEPYIEQNKIFIRLANNKFFTTSKDVVGKMITSEYDAAAAYQAFNTELSTPAADPELDISFEKGYKWDFDSKHGSQSSSAILNTLRESWGVDMAIVYAVNTPGAIYEGPAASSLLKYLFSGAYPSPALFELTGAQIKDLVGKMVEGWDCEVNPTYGFKTETMYVPHENGGLPVSSGFEMQITKNGTSYKLDGITVSGKSISDSDKYKISVCLPSLVYAETMAAAGIDSTTGDQKSLGAVIDTFAAWMKGGKQPVEPTDYVTLK